MNLSESFLTALDSILANKMRAVLTMLGVIIGVASVIALMALGTGFTADITDQIADIGTNLLMISTDFDNSGGYKTLSMSDVDALSNPLNTPDIDSVSANVGGMQIVAANGDSMSTSVSGVTANYLAMNGLAAFQLGGDLTENDVDTKARVAVLGAGIASDLFGDTFPIGEDVKVNGVGYEIVGVLEESGGGLAGNTDDSVFLPITTAQSRIYTERTRSGDKIISSITANAASAKQVERAIEQVTLTLRDTHNISYGDEDDFSIFDQTSLLDTISTVTASLTAFLGAIAAISLVVGGIGIMNIMLVSVTERTREIGIRKAVGALRRDILAQFLLESLVLSLLGGGIGIMLGWGLAAIGSSLFDIVAIVEFSTVMMSFGFAAAVGLIFGIYPAWRAASLRPIEALRYE